MSIKDKLLNVFTDANEFDEFEDENVEAPVQRETAKPVQETVAQPQVQQATVNQNTAASEQTSVNSEFQNEGADKDANLILFEPSNFREAREIGEFIKSNTAVCLNLSSIEPEEGRRIMDFVSGVIFALDGKFTKAASGVFICAPKNIGVAGKISTNAGQAQENLKKW